MEDAKTDPRVMLGDMLALRGWAVDERLGEIDCPTLVVWGEDEFPPMQEGGRALAEGIRGARSLTALRATRTKTCRRCEASVSATRVSLVPRSAHSSRWSREREGPSTGCWQLPAYVNPPALKRTDTRSASRSTSMDPWSSPER